MSPSTCGTVNFLSKLLLVNRTWAGGWWVFGVTQQALLSRHLELGGVKRKLARMEKVA